HPQSTLFPYTTLFRSKFPQRDELLAAMADELTGHLKQTLDLFELIGQAGSGTDHPGPVGWRPSIADHPQNQLRDDRDWKILITRSEEHTSELQSPYDL